VTSRKPLDTGWESWIDRQIREATERGEFDNLPGTGKPLPGLDKPYDENWWVRQKLRSEGLSYVPPSLALKKAAQDALAEALRAGSEAEVREIITEINLRILRAHRLGIDGPSVKLAPYNVKRVVREWQERRSR